jgi:YspA, cpYpsA-related SLOG family
MTRLADFFVVVVSGSRDWNAVAPISKELKKVHDEHDKVLVISGGAKGVDHSCRIVCEQNGYLFAEVPAPWFKFGIRGGPIRNSWMLLFQPNLVLCFHPEIERSKGTRDMRNKAKKAKIPVRIIPS